jgi:preprotein translocase subunit SecG
MLSQYVFGPALFFLSLFIVLIILLQRGRGGGLTGALGGAGGASAFGVKAGDVFTRITAISVLLWIVLCAITCFWYLPTKLDIESVPGSISSALDNIGTGGGIGAGSGTGQIDSEPVVPLPAVSTPVSESNSAATPSSVPPSSVPPREALPPANNPSADSPVESAEKSASPLEKAPDKAATPLPPGSAEPAVNPNAPAVEKP